MNSGLLGSPHFGVGVDGTSVSVACKSFNIAAILEWILHDC